MDYCKKDITPLLTHWEMCSQSCFVVFGCGCDNIHAFTWGCPCTCRNNTVSLSRANCKDTIVVHDVPLAFGDFGLHMLTRRWRNPMVFWVLIVIFSLVGRVITVQITSTSATGQTYGPVEPILNVWTLKDLMNVYATLDTRWIWQDNAMVRLWERIIKIITHLIDAFTLKDFIAPLTATMMTSSNGNIFRVTGPLANDAELWFFLWSEPEQTVEQTVETLVLWNAIALIMMSLWCPIILLIHCYLTGKLVPVVRNLPAPALQVGAAIRMNDKDR